MNMQNLRLDNTNKLEIAHYGNNAPALVWLADHTDTDSEYGYEFLNQLTVDMGLENPEEDIVYLDTKTHGNELLIFVVVNKLGRLTGREMQLNGYIYPEFKLDREVILNHSILTAL